MNMLKALFLCLCAIAVVSCGDDETTGPDTSPKDNAFTSKQGDYATYDVYRLDENDETVPTTATYSSRTVLRTNMSFEGKTDVTMAVDSLFVTGSTEVASVDTIYYRVENNDLYIFNFAETFVQLIPPDFPIQFDPVSGWVKVAELKETTSSFTTSLRIKIRSTTNELVVNIQVNNAGKTTVGNYTAFRQNMTATATLLTSNVTIPITLDVGGVKNVSNSPSTMIRMMIGKFTNPMSQSVVTGRVQTLTSFRAGS